MSANLEIARETLAHVAPGGAKRWTDAQALEHAIRVIARNELDPDELDQDEPPDNETDESDSPEIAPSEDE